MNLEFDSILGTIDKDPHAYYDQLRSEGDLVWDAKMGGWLVMSYELCRHIEEREELFRHPYADANEVLLEIKGGARNITVLQGEDHQNLRRYLARMFSPKAVQDYTRDILKPIISYLFDRTVGKGQADLAAEIADQLPPRVFVALLGMDWMDEALVTRELVLHEQIMEWIGGNRSAEVTQRARDASHELNAILMPQVRLRKENPGNDIISRLWAEAPEVFSDVSDEDIVATCRELFLAGSDTSVHAIANAYYLLLTQPDVLAEVANDRGPALDNFIEESLRLLTVVQYRFRVANQDVELGGVAIKRNDLLIPINAAANRDPAQFECPHMVNLKRRQPRAHLAFNMGPRVCIGAPLARAELREAINAFIDLLPNVQLVKSGTQPHFANIYTRSFRPLHVTFDAPTKS
jgi:cytochrome P450